MSSPLVSPYTDDLTRTTDIEKIVEQFIKDNWDQTKTTVALTKIKFGQWADAILSGQSDIALRVETVFNGSNAIDIASRRWEWTAYLNIDVFVLNNNTNQSYDVRAMRIMKFLEELFIVKQGDDYKGIYSFRFRAAQAMPDPDQKNIDRRRISLVAYYVADYIVNPPIVGGPDFIDDYDASDFVE